MTNYSQWFNCFNLGQEYKKFDKNPVAYFCMEYALPNDLPIYAGGLGILAGDYVTEAGQQNFPMVGVGLLYSKVCRMDKDDYIYWSTNNPLNLGLMPVRDKLGNRIKVSIPIDDHIVYAQGWIYQDRTVPIYLLDTNIEENSPKDRSIVDLLYIVDQELRIKQEIVLGIGGIKLLHALGINPSIYHMNEGHSAFLVYELTRTLMSENKLTFSEAFRRAKERIAFTCHTLVIGAHDVFDCNLVERMVSSYSREFDVPTEEFVQKGINNSADSSWRDFSTTTLAFESACQANAVSKLHAVKANEIWENHPMNAITNGININRWDKIGAGKDVVVEHKRKKKDLIDFVKKTTGVKIGQDELVIGWARRITGYKRPVSFFDNLESTRKLLSNDKMPLKIIFSGYPHYSDQDGYWCLNHLRGMARRTFRGKVIFLENYSAKVANYLTSGCDVWLNTPIVGLEACGTSTMKAALNGNLLCSTNDGWLPEIDLNDIGFMLKDNVSESLIDILSNNLLPMYYQNQTKWAEKMIKSRQTILDAFGTDRMLKDYIEQIYMPIISQDYSEE